MIRKIIMLSVIAALFVYVLVYFSVNAILYNPLSDSTTREFKPRRDEAVLIPPYTPAWKSIIYEKNLFSPSRSYKRSVPVTEVPAEPPPARPAVVLKGIIIDPFGDHIAYITIDQLKAVPMRRGDKIEGIELLDISDRKVMLQWNTEKINLTMDKIKKIQNPRLKR
jgi:hypothetical protein